MLSSKNTDVQNSGRDAVKLVVTLPFVLQVEHKPCLGRPPCVVRPCKPNVGMLYLIWALFPSANS